MTNQKTSKQDKLVITMIILIGFSFLVGAVFTGYIGKEKWMEQARNETLNNSSIIGKWIEQGKNETLNNLTLMMEVGNNYVISSINYYNGTLPIYVKDKLNNTQVWTCSKLTRIK